MSDLRPIGTRYTESYCSYQNEYRSISHKEEYIVPNYPIQIHVKNYEITYEVIDHKNGREIIKIVEENIT